MEMDLLPILTAMNPAEPVEIQLDQPADEGSPAFLPVLMLFAQMMEPSPEPVALDDEMPPAEEIAEVEPEVTTIPDAIQNKSIVELTDPPATSVLMSWMAMVQRPEPQVQAETSTAIAEESAPQQAPLKQSLPTQVQPLPLPIQPEQATSPDSPMAPTSIESPVTAANLPPSSTDSNPLETLLSLPPEPMQAQTSPAQTQSPISGMSVQAPAVTPPATSPSTATISLPVNHPQWSEDFNQQIIWLGQQQVKAAVIQLNPESLGPLHIQLKVDDLQAHLTVVSQNHQVRDLVERGLPMLREMLAGQGIQLADAQVHTQSQAFKQQQPALYEASRPYFEGQEEPDASLTITARAVKGIIDYFA